MILLGTIIDEVKIYNAKIMSARSDVNNPAAFTSTPTGFQQRQKKRR